MTLEKRKFQHLKSDDILTIYQYLQSQGEVLFDYTQESVNKLDSIVNNINSTHFGIDIYKTVGEKITAYLYFMIQDHPFIDGNKRTAILTYLVLIDLNNLEIINKDIEIETLAVFITESPIDHHLLIKDLAKIMFSQEMFF